MLSLVTRNVSTIIRLKQSKYQEANFKHFQELLEVNMRGIQCKLSYEFTGF
jgi:hypothetical protein